MSGSGFPQIEINKMHISQSIEVKCTDMSPCAGGLGLGELRLMMCSTAHSWNESLLRVFSSLFMKGCS